MLLAYGNSLKCDTPIPCHGIDDHYSNEFNLNALRTGVPTFILHFTNNVVMSVPLAYVQVWIIT